MKKSIQRYFSVILILITLTTFFLVYFSFDKPKSAYLNTSWFDHERILLNKELSFTLEKKYKQVKCYFKGDANKYANCLRKSQNGSFYLPFDFFRKRFDVKLDKIFLT